LRSGYKNGTRRGSLRRAAIPLRVHSRVHPGTVTLSHDFHPDQVLYDLSLDIEFLPSKAGGIQVELPPYLVGVGGHPHIADYPPHFAFIARTTYHDILRSAPMAIQPGTANTLRVTYEDGCVRVGLNDGEPMEFTAEYRPSVDRLRICMPPECVVHRLQAGGTVRPRGKPVRAKRYEYHMTNDPAATLAPGPYTKQMWEAMLKGLAQRGYSRVYWIYYGGFGAGLWDWSQGSDLVEDHALRTRRNVGDNLLRFAVPLAHKYGLEIYATIKPFDLALGQFTVPKGSNLARKRGKGALMGGELAWSDNFAATNRHLWWKRRPGGRVQGPVRKLVFSHLGPDTSRIREVKLWVSRDNWKYRAYEGNFTVTREPGRIVIDGLDIREPFLAVTPVPFESRYTFVNTPDRLLVLYNAHGEEIPFTYGFVPRSHYEYPEGKATDDYRVVYGDFREEGVFLDIGPQFGIPTCVMCGAAPQNYWYALDNEHGLVVAALGKQPEIAGLLCPSEPEARNYWLKWVGEALDFGVDGVAIRRWNHSNSLEWQEYGFNEIPCREFEGRYGIDPRHEDFDMQAWRRLRGESYTQFLREASERVRSRGKRFAVHIDDQMEGGPDVSTHMEIHWDWETWLNEKLPDEVIFKSLSEESVRRHSCRE